MRSRSHPRMAMIAVLAIAACSSESGESAERPIVVEDAGPAEVVGREPAPGARPSASEPQPAPEIVFAPEPVRSEDDAPAPPPADPPAEKRAGDEAVPSDPVDPAGAPEPVERSGEAVDRGPSVVPAGTRIEVELRTPFHSATTRIGDRFAARTREPIEASGRRTIEPDALVEGRVVRVASAEGSDDGGWVELELKALVLPTGERVPLSADVAAVEPRKVVSGRARSKAEGAVVGAGAGGAAGAVLGGSREATAIGAILGGVAGAVLVSGKPDHELVVPSGTRLVLTLSAPLELPAGE